MCLFISGFRSCPYGCSHFLLRIPMVFVSLVLNLPPALTPALMLIQDRRKIQELDRQIAATQARVLEQRQKMGGLNASQENNEMIAKQIRTLENRLDKVSTATSPNSVKVDDSAAEYQHHVAVLPLQYRSVPLEQKLPYQ